MACLELCVHISSSKSYFVCFFVIYPHEACILHFHGYHYPTFYWLNFILFYGLLCTIVVQTWNLQGVLLGSHPQFSYDHVGIAVCWWCTHIHIFHESKTVVNVWTPTCKKMAASWKSRGWLYTIYKIFSIVWVCPCPRNWARYYSCLLLKRHKLGHPLSWR